MYSEKKEMKGSCIHDSIQEQQLKKQSFERLILLELIKVTALKNNYLKNLGFFDNGGFRIKVH